MRDVLEAELHVLSDNVQVAYAAVDTYAEKMFGKLWKRYWSCQLSMSHTDGGMVIDVDATFTMRPANEIST